jgi:hypothetical protein
MRKIRIQKIELRETWKHDTTNFIRWMAIPVKVVLLNE